MLCCLDHRETTAKEICRLQVNDETARGPSTRARWSRAARLESTRVVDPPVATRNGNGPSPPMQTLATIAALTTLTGTTDGGPGCGAQDFSNTGSWMPGTGGPRRR